MNCAYCSKDCKLVYCSKECADKRTKILRDIEHIKQIQKKKKGKFTEEQMDKFRQIKQYLCN